jgi:L,D-transpeptidase ErfK/SrfK
LHQGFFENKLVRRSFNSRSKLNVKSKSALAVVCGFRALMRLIVFLGVATWAHSLTAAEPTRVVGNVSIHLIEKGETLLDIARENGFGILEVMAANQGVDPWLPEPGSLIELPKFKILPDAPQRGLVINLAELRIYFYGDDTQEPRSYPIGIGRLGFTTPLGKTKIVKKKINPEWYPTKEARTEDPTLPEMVPSGPNNPMGQFALYLGWPLYAIHGTNSPWGVGRRVSRGCIRLYPEDIEELFRLVDVGMQVTVVDQIAKIAWKNNDLFLETHPSRQQLDALEASGSFEPEPIEGLM